MNDFVIGDQLALEQLCFAAAGCHALTTHLDAEVICVLDAGHVGVHVAADSRLTVVATWV